MTDDETEAWLRLLGRTREMRIAVLRDLMRHATEDRMSTEDRTLCLRALEDLGATHVFQTSTSTHTHRSMRKYFDSARRDAHI